MTLTVYTFGADRAAARRLADALGASKALIRLNTHPDGESLPVVPSASPTAILYRALERPDDKLMPLLLAADALRRRGSQRVVLVAPYMPYLRQDAVFEPGQPLSRDVFGRLLGPAFDRIVTVEPHLHRTADLTPVFAGTPVDSLSAGELLAEAIGRRAGPVIVGPDAESEPWVRAIADRLEAPWVVAQKHRLGDREVEVTLPVSTHIAGRRAVLVDDIASTGATLVSASQALFAAGAAAVEVAVVHGLYSRGLVSTLRRAGVRAVVCTDSCSGRPGAISLAPLLARALSSEI